MSSSHSFIYDRSGQLKITLWELADFHHDLPVQLFAQLPGNGPHEDEQEGITPEAKLSIEGSAKYNCGYCFAYSGEPEIRLGVRDRSGVLAESTWELAEVIRNGSEKQWLQLHPQGKIWAELGWIAAPEVTPANITVSDLHWTPIDSLNAEGRRYYVTLHLNDEPCGSSAPQPVIGGSVKWPEAFIRPYNTEAVAMFTVYEEGNEEMVCFNELDLWGFFKHSDKPCVKGDVGVQTPQQVYGGQMYIRINFWDTPEESKREARHFDDLPKEKPAAQPAPTAYDDPVARRMASIPPSSHDGDTLNEKDIEHALDDARRAADAAAADAARAREVADLLKATPMTGSHAAEAVRGADKAAKAAGEDAARARAIVDDLEQRRPNKAADLDVAVRDASDLAKKVRGNRDLTIERGRDAAAVSARELARAARESHRAADRWARDTTQVADGYPNIRQFGPLVEDAANAASNASDDARVAYARAEDAEDADNLHAALEACKDVRKAAVHAKREEETAEDAYKRAVALARKADKAAEKRLKKKQEEEEEALRKAKEDRERMRKEEHEADMARRRDNLLMAGDANEQGVYAGTMAYAFHGTADKHTLLDGGSPSAQPWMCCGGSPITQRAKGSRRGSNDSLRASIPAYELRGQEPIQSRAEEMMEASPQGWCTSPATKAVPFAIFDDDGLVETLMHRRAQCWCFGCGCMRCCGEC